jgi:UDP-N-acetylmuramoylalanine--D-glutamate ligase
VVLVLGGLDKSLDFTRLRDPVKERVRALIVLGQAATKLESTFSDLVPVFHAENILNCVHMAMDAAKSGDTVLFSPGCASFDMFRNYKDRGEKFKTVVREL